MLAIVCMAVSASESQAAINFILRVCEPSVVSLSIAPGVGKLEFGSSITASAYY